MAQTIDDMLEPDERVLFRENMSKGRFLRPLAACGITAGIFSALWLALGEVPWQAYLIIGYYFGQVTLAAGDEREVAVTDRRVLVSGWTKAVPAVEIALSDVVGLHPEAPVSTHSISFEISDGGMHRSIEVPDAERFSAAVVLAAGRRLSLPYSPAAARAARWLGRFSCIGCHVGIASAFGLLAMLVDPQNPDAAMAIALALIFTILVPLSVGTAVGWFLGTLLGLACLRPVTAAAAIREAIRSREPSPDPPYGLQLDRRSRLIRVWLAGWLYGVGAERADGKS